MRTTPGPRLSWADLRDFSDGGLAIRERHGFKSNPASADHEEYCRKYIEDLQAGAKGNPKSKRTLTRMAYARCSLAEVYMFRGEEERNHAELLKALSEATAAGYHDVLYRCLHGLGAFHLTKLQPDLDASIKHFQKAMQYAWTTTPVLRQSSLMFMALAFERKGQPDQALMIFEWMINVDPYDLYSRILKFESLIKTGRKPAVKQSVKSGPGETCESVANYIAAQKALKAKYDETSAAQLGLLLAKSSGDKYWDRLFRSILKPDDPEEQ